MLRGNDVRADLFDDIINSAIRSCWILRVIVHSPRSVGAIILLRPVKKPREVAVRHVLILGASHKPRLDRKLGVTEDHHCGTHK